MRGAGPVPGGGSGPTECRPSLGHLSTDAEPRNRLPSMLLGTSMLPCPERPLGLLPSAIPSQARRPGLANPGSGEKILTPA
jgi:hypothetical protein